MTDLAGPPVRLAIIGCGAIARAHLLAAQCTPNVEVTTLIDKDAGRAEQLAKEFNIALTHTDYRFAFDKAEAVIIALPHHLHAQVTIEALQNGLHVLVEKPMALTSHECNEMIEAASRSAKYFAVGQLRRFFYSSLFVKRLIETQLLGRILSFDVREGTVFNWPVVSKFTFEKETGGGVLYDSGTHVLDLLLWWLGERESVVYFDDAMGGVEADCELQLQLRSGATGVVELSRTRDLRNTVILRGEYATVEIESKFDSQIRLQIHDEDTVLCGRAMVDKKPRDEAVELFVRQLDNFAGTILGQDSLFIPGTEGKRAIELIEACHGVRQTLVRPWDVMPRAGGQEFKVS